MAQPVMNVITCSFSVHFMIGIYKLSSQYSINWVAVHCHIDKMHSSSPYISWRWLRNSKYLIPYILKYLIAPHTHTQHNLKYHFIPPPCEPIMRMHNAISDSHCTSGSSTSRDRCPVWLDVLVKKSCCFLSPLLAAIEQNTEVSVMQLVLTMLAFKWFWRQNQQEFSLPNAHCITILPVLHM